MADAIIPGGHESAGRLLAAAHADVRRIAEACILAGPEEI